MQLVAARVLRVPAGVEDGLEGEGPEGPNVHRPGCRCAVTGCGKLYRARSRLYRKEILQENMRLKALAEIYTMHSFAQL